ncbi:hypothetical protein COOONC_15288 [Cooperia oncophora]
MSDSKKERIAAFVTDGGDGMLLLGTNALRPFGYDLTKRKCSEPVVLPPITVDEDIPMQKRNRPLPQRKVCTTSGYYLSGSSPAVFQHMHAVLEPLLGYDVFCCLDNMVVVTETVQRHFQILERVFEQLLKARLRLNSKKCVLLERKVEFLGHVIDCDGLYMSPAKMEAIRRCPYPNRARTFKRFSGNVCVLYEIESCEDYDSPQRFHVAFTVENTTQVRV